MTDRDLWSYREIAAHIRVQPDTVRSYRKNGQLPPTGPHPLRPPLLARRHDPPLGGGAGPQQGEVAGAAPGVFGRARSGPAEDPVTPRARSP